MQTWIWFAPFLFFVQHVPTHHDNLYLAANDEAMDASFALSFFILDQGVSRRSLSFHHHLFVEGTTLWFLCLPRPSRWHGLLAHWRVHAVGWVDERPHR